MFFPFSVTSLFEFYRLNYVVVKFQPLVNDYPVNAFNAQPGMNIPEFMWHYDYDDASVPLNINEIVGRGDLKTRVFNRPISFGFKPAVLNMTYESLTSTGYTPKWGQWLSIRDTNVPYYGIKHAFRGARANAQIHARVSYTYYVSFKKTK